MVGGPPGKLGVNGAEVRQDRQAGGEFGLARARLAASSRLER
jgi:hypothetical protein